MAGVPKHAALVTRNLFSAIKMICEKVLPRLPISGNIDFEDDQLLIDEEMHRDDLGSTNLDINKTVMLDEYIQGSPGEEEDLEYGEEGDPFDQISIEKKR